MKDIRELLPDDKPFLYMVGDKIIEENKTKK